MKLIKEKKGFTLVELVVVIAILGILAGIAIPRFMEATKSARGAKIVADMRTIESAINVYYVSHGEYPADNTDTDFLTIVNGGTWPAPPVGDFTIANTDGTDPTEGTTAATSVYLYTSGNTATDGSTSDEAGTVTLKGATIGGVADTTPTVSELLGN